MLINKDDARETTFNIGAVGISRNNPDYVAIDVINTLSKFYNIQVPIFIDNRESITKILENTKQIINLVVNPECENLTIK